MLAPHLTLPFEPEAAAVGEHSFMNHARGSVATIGAAATRSRMARRDVDVWSSRRITMKISEHPVRREDGAPQRDDGHWIRTLLFLALGAVVLGILGFVLFLALYAWADIH